MNIMTLNNLSTKLLILASMLFGIVFQIEAIINGENAQFGEFPYIVSLRNKSGNHYCAGTLVTPIHIVTSAQCVYEDNSVFKGGEAQKLKTEDISVVVGTLSRTEGGESYKIEKFVPHPDYNVMNTVSMNNDIAVVVLKTPVNTPNVATIRSSVTDIPKDGTEGTTAGWGLLQFKPVQVNASVLQKLTVNIQNREVCKKEWQEKLGSTTESPSELEQIIDEIFSESIICVLPNPTNATNCLRDAGNPLIVNNEFVGFIIAAYGCSTGIANLCTSWTAYRPFVQQVIAGEIQ